MDSMVQRSVTSSGIQKQTLEDGRLRVVERQELLERIAERRAAFEAAKGGSPASAGEANATISFVA